MENSGLSLLEELLEQHDLESVDAVLLRRAAEVNDQLLDDLQAFAYRSLERGHVVDEALSLITVGEHAAKVAGNPIGQLKLLLARGRIARSQQSRPELVQFAEQSIVSGRDLSASLLTDGLHRAAGFYFDFTEELARMKIAGGQLDEARRLWSAARERLQGDPMLEFGAAFRLSVICYQLRDLDAATRYALLVAKLFDPEQFRRQRPDAQMGSSSDVCEVLYGIGRALRAAGELENAARLFSAVVELEPGFRDARFQLGFCQMFGADIHAAVRTWKEISESDPSNPDALANYAQSLGAVGRTKEALSALEAALERKPEDPRLRMLRGGFLASLGRHAEAADDFAAFLATAKDEDRAITRRARISRTRSLLKAGALAAAIEEAQRMVDDEDEETHWLGMTLLAEVQASSGDTDQALRTYDEVVDADPSDLSVRLARLDLLVTAGRSQQSLDEIRYIARRDRNPKAALERLERLLAEHPNDYELKKLRAYANLQAGAPDLAERELTDLLAHTPGSAEALHWRGIARLTSRYDPDETGWNEGLNNDRIIAALGDLAGAVRNAPDNQEYYAALLWLVDRGLGHPYFRLWIELMSAREDGLALVLPELTQPFVHLMTASHHASVDHWDDAVAELLDAQAQFRAMNLPVSAQRLHGKLADNRIRLYQLQQAMDDIERARAVLWMHFWPLTPYLVEKWQRSRSARQAQVGEQAAGIELEYRDVLARLFCSEYMYTLSVLKADALRRIGRSEEAVAELVHMGRALENVSEALEQGVSMQTLLSVVWIYRDAGELARAREVLERLRPFVESDHDRAVLLGLEGTLLEFEGRLDDAFVKYRELRSLVPKLGRGMQFVNAMQLAGNCCERHAFSDALEVLDAADITAARSQNDHFAYHLHRARALHGLDRAAEALRDIRAALALVDDMRSHFTLYESRTSWLGRSQRFFDIGVRIAADAGQPAEAFALVEKAKARTFLDQLADVQAAAQASAGPLQSTLRNVSELRDLLTGLLESARMHGMHFVSFEELRRIRDLDATISVIETTAEGGISLVPEKVSEELRKIEATRADLDRRIEEETLASSQASEGPVSSFDDVRALLESEEKLLGNGRHLILAEYYVFGESTLLFLVRSDFQAPQMRWLDFGISRLAAATAVLEAVLDPQKPEFDASFDQLFRPLVDPILEIANENDVICNVPHGVLHYCPIDLVQAGQRRLCDRNPILYSPSSSLLPQTLKRRRGRAGRALVFGDPGGDLPFARDEAIVVSEVLGVSARLGPRATKVNLLADLAAGGTFDVVHLACHGYFDPNDAMDSGIVLASGEGGDKGVRLTAKELLRVRMDASLVVLSACDTGRNLHRKGDELVGLSRSLFRAGAASVLVSRWAVDDVATTLLLTQFYRLLRDERGGRSPLPKCDALRAAQAFVRAFSAAELVQYCDQRLGQLSVETDRRGAVRMSMVKARAQSMANDFEAAAATLEALEPQISTRDPSLADVRKRIESARVYISAHLRGGSLPKANYGGRPFDSPYYWGAFVLQGDWI